LANVLFTNELARRLEGTGISCFSLHPYVNGINLTPVKLYICDCFACRYHACQTSFSLM
jgi:NAD(P)-dependent dehydrogenase (short-subunit alcohol dehydrogenase family)